MGQKIKAEIKMGLILIVSGERIILDKVLSYQRRFRESTRNPIDKRESFYYIKIITTEGAEYDLSIGESDNEVEDCDKIITMLDNHFSL
jgi:hypothetical protein